MKVDLVKATDLLRVGSQRKSSRLEDYETSCYLWVKALKDRGLLVGVVLVYCFLLWVLMTTPFLVPPLLEVVRWKRVLLLASLCLDQGLGGRVGRVGIQAMDVTRHSTERPCQMKLRMLGSRTENPG